MKHLTLYATRQRGVASLAVTMIMLALMALVVLYLNRGVVFEQRTSGNQYRATRAFEVAEAGLEWALARLNDGSSLVPGGACTPVVSTTANAIPFLNLYAPFTTSGTNLTDYNYTPPASSRAACSIADNGALACHCPAPGTAPTLGAPGTRNFRVSFIDEPNDPEAIRVTSHGCVDPAGICNPTSTTGGRGDAIASITTLVKRVKGLNGTPAAALITGGWSQVCSSYSIDSQVSTCAGATGNLVNSGSQIRIGNGLYLSGNMPAGAPNGCGGSPSLGIPAGTPIAATMAPNDPELASLAQNADAMFFSIFGQTKDAYKAQAAADGCFITTNSTDVMTAYARTINPCSRFWLDVDMIFNGTNVLGSAANNTTSPPTVGRQVVLASDRSLDLRGTFTLYGILYADNVSYSALGTGTSDIYGAVIARNNYQNNGNGAIHYDACGLGGLTADGKFERVPGSWIDDVPNTAWW